MLGRHTRERLAGVAGSLSGFARRGRSAGVVRRLDAIHTHSAPSMKTLVLANQKGGVGKSAVASLVAYYLAHIGKRVLAIDFDHQGNFSSPIVLSNRAKVSEASSDQLLSTMDPSLPEASFVLVPAGDDLLWLERQAAQHTPFARNFRAFLKRVDGQFDACVIDTHPSPDIRLISALASADFVVAPIQLNQEAIDGVRNLLGHPRIGFQKIKALLNPKLHFIGLLPTMVEMTPFQRANLRDLIERHLDLMVRLDNETRDLALIPKRSAIAEAQAAGAVLWEVKKTAARDTWVEIKPTIAYLASVLTRIGVEHAV